MKKIKKDEIGITIIALVITIIVLLILAGITIAMLTGDNGILTKATESSETSEREKTRERIGLSVQAANIEGKGQLEYNNLNEELKKEFGEGNYKILNAGKGYLIIVDNVQYKIDAGGNVEEGKEINNSNIEYAGDLSKGGTYDGTTEEKAYRINCIEDLVEWSNNYSKYNSSYMELEKTLNFEKNNANFCDFFIDYIIWPEELLTQDIFRIVTVAHALDVENFADGRARLLEYKVQPYLPIIGKKVKDCGFTQNTLMVGLTRNGELFIPNGDTEIQEDDKLIFMGTSHSLDILAGTFFHEKEIVKSAAIIGGGNVGMMLAKSLEKLRIKTKVIEKDYDRCRLLAEELTNTLVINGDGTNLKLLDEEEIGAADVVISVTNNDERNLLCSLLAKQLGVKRVIARVAKVINIPLFEKVGIDIAVSPKNSAINEVKNDLQENDVDILATVEQGQGEVLEINVIQDFNGQKIKDIKFPAGAIIGVIIRKNNIIIPYGETEIYTDDILIIFTTSDNAGTIKEFFKVK